MPLMTLVIFAVLGISPIIARAEIILGVLEEAPKIGEAEKLATNLRLAFRKDASGWIPICKSKGDPPWSDACHWSNTDVNRDWLIVHRGRPIGSVTTAGWLNEKRYWTE